MNPKKRIYLEHKEAIELILADKLEDFKRGLSEAVIIDTVAVE